MRNDFKSLINRVHGSVLSSYRPVPFFHVACEADELSGSFLTCRRVILTHLVLILFQTVPFVHEYIYRIVQPFLVEKRKFA